MEGFGRIPRNLRFATSLLISNSNLNPYTKEATAEKTFSTFIFGRKKGKLPTIDQTNRMISTAIPETMVGQSGQIVGEKMDLGYKPIKKEAEELMVSSRLKLKNIVTDDGNDDEDEFSHASRTQSRISVQRELTEVKEESQRLPSIKPTKLPTIESETFINANIPPPPPNLTLPPPNKAAPPPPNLDLKSATSQAPKELKDLPKPQPNRASLLDQIKAGNHMSKLRPISKMLENGDKEIPLNAGQTVKRSEQPRKTHVHLLLF